jgi:hypothetical protein
VQADDFWRLIEQVRQRVREGDTMGEDIAAGVVARLSFWPLEEILAYDRCFRREHERAFHALVWSAAALIWNGCGDDSFSSFRAGLIGLGREAFERALADPDTLADHPLVQRIARGEVKGEVLYMESLENAASTAYDRVAGTNDVDDYWDAVAQASGASTGEQPPAVEAPPTRDGLDDAVLHRRLPRLAALFRGEDRTGGSGDPVG